MSDVRGRPTASGVASASELGVEGLPLGTFDRLAILAVFLQASELYRPLAYITGIVPQRANMAFVGFYVLYLALNSRPLARLLNTGLGQIWAVAFLLVDLMLLVQWLRTTVTLDRAVYWFGFTSVFMGTFAVAAVLFLKHGDRLVRPFFLWLIAASWLGFLINMQNYALIRRVQIYTGNRLASSESLDRVVGFYQHPNMAALALTLSLAVLVTNRRFMGSSLLLHATVLAATVGGVVVTGSRTSTLLIGFVVLWYLVTTFKISGSSRQAATRAVIAPAVLLLAAVVALAALTAVVGRGSEIYSTMTERLSSLPAIVTGDDANDLSLAARQSARDFYVEKVQERPMVGFGPDYAGEQIEAGSVGNVSQNSWLEWAVEFGLVYPLVVALALVLTFRASRRLRGFDPWMYGAGALIVFLMVGASFSVVGLLALRTPVFVLGALLGLLIQTRNLSETAERVPS